jgi:hypothetical protein
MDGIAMGFGDRFQPEMGWELSQTGSSGNTSPVARR